MLPARARLRRRDDFVTALREGRRRTGGTDTPLLTVHLASPPRGSEAGESNTRAGFVVSRAVGGAVARNRVRRRLQHLAADRLPQVPAGSRLVVRALPAAAAASYADLAVAMSQAIDRVMRPDARKVPGCGAC